MNVREVENKDVETVSAICMDSFLNSVADTLSEEGISSFAKIAASDAFACRMKEDNLILIAENNNNINGVIELKEGRHIAMLFVKPQHQRKGVGRKLLLSALEHARYSTVTVSASLTSITAYKKFGFTFNGSIAESGGLVYQPMQIEL